MMLEKMKEDFNQDKKEMDDYFKEREIKWANFFNSYRTSTVISNEEHQQQHQDHNATIRIQAIFHGYSTQHQHHLQQISAISMQAVAHEFIVQQQMIKKHIAA
eukprot:12978579-Ditylum_brightwellii.AAC.1